MTEEQEKILNKYIENAKLIGHTLQGVRGLKNRLPKYFEYLNENGIDMYKIKVKDALDFQKWLIDTGRKKDGTKYCNNTIANYMKGACNFNNYLKREKLIYCNVFLEIKKIRGERKLPRNILKEKEINLLLKELASFDKCKGNLVSKITAYKIHVVSELLYSTGIRSTEACNLKDSDIDFEKGIVNVIEGKGGVSRIAFLNEYAKKILKLYVEEMKALVFNVWNKKNDTLFGMGWERFNSAINKVLRVTCRRLKLISFTSHCFRHSLGYHLLRSGCDIRYIQGILGHKKLSSTEIYTKVDKEDLMEVFNKYHPRQFKVSRDENINQ